MFDRRKALWEAATEGVKKGVCQPGDRMRIAVALLRPRVRQEIFDMIDSQCLSAGLITEEGDVVDGEGFSSTWLLIIELLIQFLPVILEFLRKRNS
jgi:hypothetical protein